jgi:hypothetical protein
MKGLWVFPMILAMVFLPLACSDDDEEGEGGGGNAAVAFTAGNASSAAAMFAATVSPFAEVSLAGLAVVQAAETAAGGFATHGTAASTARDLVELGDLGLCDSGQSTGTWDDRDGDLTLSAGDVLEVTLAACDDITSASLTLTLADVGYALTTATAVFEADIVDVDQTAATSGLSGAFRVEMNRVPEPPLFICRLLVSAQSDPTQHLGVTSDGVAAMDLGCFNLYFTFDLDSGGFTLSEPLAVFRIADAGIMSIQSWGLPALTFPDSETPETGQVRFVAYSSATPCAALGVPGDGIDSNESFLVLTATGGGNITLMGQAADGAPIAVETTWDQLD